MQLSHYWLGLGSLERVELSCLDNFNTIILILLVFTLFSPKCGVAYCTFHTVQWTPVGISFNK